MKASTARTLGAILTAVGGLGTIAAGIAIAVKSRDDDKPVRKPTHKIGSAKGCTPCLKGGGLRGKE